MTFISAVVVSLLSKSETDKDKRIIIWVCLVAAVAAFVTSVAKALVTWKTQEAKESPHELSGCLHTLYSILTVASPTNSDPQIRITVHVPKDGKHLAQVLPYVGSEKRKKSPTGRLTSIHCGIAGRAFRTKKPALLQRTTTDLEEYIKDLTTNQGFIQEDARSLDSSTMSGYAVPLTGTNGSVVGIVYVNSTSKDFFAEDQVRCIDAACVGIARFVDDKYS